MKLSTGLRGKRMNIIEALACISALLIICGIGIANPVVSDSWHYIKTDESLMEALKNSSSNILCLEDGIHYGPLILINLNNITIKPFSDGATIECMGADVGIHIIGGSNITIQGISLNNSKNGIKIEGGRDCVIKDNYINFNNGAGITLDGTYSSKILKNVIKNDNIGNLFSNGLEAYFSMGNLISENSFILQANSTLILLFNSLNNMISLSQCGIIIDNSNKCECVMGCYKCERDSSLNNSWNLKPNFC